jgi:hypothetical protein
MSLVRAALAAALAALHPMPPAAVPAASSASAAAVDGLLYQLPADGSWARFDVSYTYQAGGQRVSGTQSFRMASVGSVTENGEEHRWIEFHIVEGDRFWTRKLLIPVRYLRRGENPTLHVVRGWTLQEDREVEPAVAVHGRWPAYLTGKLQDEKPLPQEVVDSKLGRLTTDGVTGWIEFTEDKLHTRVTYETRLHPEAPFGVVSSRVRFECSGDGPPYTIDGTMTLAEVGTGATTSLPKYR